MKVTQAVVAEDVDLTDKNKTQNRGNEDEGWAWAQVVVVVAAYCFATEERRSE